MSKLSNAVDTILSGHKIHGGFSEKNLRDMSRGELIETFLGKSDNETYLSKIREADKLWLEDKDFVNSAIRAKEEYFTQQFDSLSEKISSEPLLKKFKADYTNLPNDPSAELVYNETIRQVRNFAESEFETPNKILREKISELDPRYSFKSIGYLPWSEQNPLLETTLTDLQETALDVHNMIGEVKSFWPDFDAQKKLEGKSLDAQYRFLSRTLENNRNYILAKENFANFANSLSVEEFNNFWSDKTGGQAFRRAYRQATDNVPVHSLSGTFYRDFEFKEAKAAEFAEARAVEQQRLESVKSVSPEQQTRLDQLRQEKAIQREKRESETRRGDIEYIDPNGKRIYYSKEDLETLPAEIRVRVEAQEKLRADIKRYNSRVPESTPEIETTTKVPATRVVNEPLLGRNNFKNQDLTVADSTQQRATPVSESVNEVTKDTVQLKTIGESESSRIEREAIEKTYNLKRDLSRSALLSEDTARSYVFGYKQKALLGFMGTAGAVSLLEASMSGPNAEAIERRRRLEEERRRKQLGY